VFELVNDKKTGSFFTPAALACSIVEYVVNNLAHLSERKLSILEPSVGEGAFLWAISQIGEAAARIEIIDAVDIEPAFIEECRSIGFSATEVEYYREDFIDFSGRPGGYDVILGNPPYVSYKHLSNEQIATSRGIFKENGLNSSDFRNIWTLFLLKATVLLKPDGMMAFVLPKEIIYVNHASWLRSLLLREFARVDVFVFDELHFDHADQDVAVIICYRQHDSGGLYISESRGVQINFEGLRFIEVDQFYGSKWSQFKISDGENAILRRCVDTFRPLETYCTAVAGIVPAANSFFIINDRQVEELGLRDHVKPIVQKSNYIGRSLILDSDLMSKLSDLGLPAYLLAGYDYVMPPPEILSYLEAGETQNLDKRYKMTKRDPWHRIPGIWSSEALFFKRIGELPKFVLNTAGALVTDTAYRVTPREGVDLRSLIFSFYNSVTMVAAELRGRTYGGGVLELTPNEFKGLPVPFEPVTEDDFTHFVERMKSSSFSDALAEQDNYLLPRAGISSSGITTIQRMRHELYDKRLKKGRPKA
jgi:adenine-specific DNA-methyltransferase